MEYRHNDPVLIIGAGVGGAAMLDIFARDAFVQIAGIVDTNKHAIGIQHALKKNIPVFHNIEEALTTLGSCSVFNMTNNDKVSSIAAQYVGIDRVIGGQEAKLFWQMISRLKNIQGKLQDNQSRLKAVIHNVCEGIITTSTLGVIENINPAMERIFGYPKAELVGKNIRQLLSDTDLDIQRTFFQTATNGSDGYHETAGVRKNGDTFTLEINTSAMTLDGKEHIVGILRDISERKEAEDKMIQLALYDQLTKLPNRTLFYERLQFCLSQVKRSKEPLALLFIDLDGFKAINDTFGHDAGDHLLIEISKRLSQSIRKSDVASRLGGDEFTVILTNLTNLDKIPCIAEHIITKLSQPIHYQGNNYSVGASVGIAVYPDHASNTDDLVKAADSAMYQAKKTGTNQFCITSSTQPDN